MLKGNKDTVEWQRKSFTLTGQNEGNVYLANTSCAANHAASFRLLTNRQADGRMDGCFSEKSRGAMWSSCLYLDLVNRAACQNNHTWCPSFSVSVSLLNLSTPFWEIPSAPLHTHTVWHTHKRRMGLTVYMKVHMSTVHSSAPSNFLRPFQKSSCFLLFPLPYPLTKSRFIQLPASFTYGVTEVEGRCRKHLGPARLTFLPSLGIFRIRAQTSALFWHSVKSLRYGGDKGVIYLSVPGFGCLEWQIFPTLLFLFFFFVLSGKWSWDVNWDVGAQANRLDCGRRSKRERGCAWKEVIFKLLCARLKASLLFFYFQFFDRKLCQRVFWNGSWCDDGKLFLQDAAV